MATAFETVFAKLIALVEPQHTITISPAPVTPWPAVGKSQAAAAFNAAAVADAQKPVTPQRIANASPKPAQLDVHAATLGGVLGTSTTDGVVTHAELAAAINQTTNALRSLIYQNESAPNSAMGTGGFTNEIAASNKIDQLSGTTLTNVIVNGVSGLTTSQVSEGSNLYFTNARVAAYVESSSTIPTAAGTLGTVLSWNGSSWTAVATSSLGIVGGGGGTWGTITGTLSNQTDLQSALDAKLSLTNWYATTTDALHEGTTNLYFTNARFDARLAATTSLPNLLAVSPSLFWQNGPTFNLSVGANGLNTTVSQAGGGLNGQGNTAVGVGALNGNTTGYHNTGLGYLAGAALTTGYSNTALGEGALWQCPTCYQSVAIGIDTLAQPTNTGAFNIGIGNGALNGNTTGSFNVAVGHSALGSNTSANGNVAVGYVALGVDTTGDSNVATGFQAMNANTTGGRNVANGYGALYSNTTGGNNVANGYESMFFNTTGGDNVANGYAALYNNTTGNYNTANGFDSLYNNTTGSANIAIGNGSLYYNMSATTTVAVGNAAGQGTGLYYNQGGTYVGYDAGLSAATASNYNTFLGYQTGYDVTTGTNNTIIGSEQTTNTGITTGSNNILIGQDLQPKNIPGLSQTASNQLDIGNLIFGTGLSYGSTLSTGNIGIGTSSPSQLLTVGNNNQFTVTSAGALSAAGATFGSSIVVSGSATPSPNGTYGYAGQYNGAPYYANGTSWYIWYRPSGSNWFLSTTLGGYAPDWYLGGTASSPPINVSWAADQSPAAGSPYLSVGSTANVSIGIGGITWAQSTVTNDSMPQIIFPTRNDGTQNTYQAGSSIGQTFQDSNGKALASISFNRNASPGGGGARSSSEIRFNTTGSTYGADNLNFSTKMIITGGGNVGIGTQGGTLSAKLVVNADNGDTNSNIFLIASSTASATTTLFNVTNTGSATLAGTLTQNSDQRLKTDIQPLNASSSLTAIEALNPVSYQWAGNIFGSGEQAGFIAQQVQSVFPNLVSTTSPTALTPDGTLGLNYIGLISPIVAAIQALDKEVTSLAATVAGFAESISTNVLNAATGHFSNQLCVGSTCVTPTQFQAMVSAAGQSNSGSSDSAPSSAGEATDTPPVIQINGDNPAVIQVGASYADLGATITGPAADLNLGVKTFVNGLFVSNILLDTSAAATDTIDYVVTDGQGLTSTSTRTVIIEAANDNQTSSATSTAQ